MKTIEKGNKIYKMKKSDSFLDWGPFSTRTIFKSETTSNENISQPNTDAKYSKGESINKNILKYSEEELNNFKNAKKLRFI